MQSTDSPEINLTMTYYIKIRADGETIGQKLVAKPAKTIFNIIYHNDKPYSSIL